MASSSDLHIFNAPMDFQLPLIPQMNNCYNNCDDESTLSIKTAETSTTSCPLGCEVLKKETKTRDLRAHVYRWCKKVNKEQYPFIYGKRFVNDLRRMVQGQKGEYPTELHELMAKNMDGLSPEIREELLNFKTEVFDPVEDAIMQKKRQKELQKELQKKLQSGRKHKEVVLGQAREKTRIRNKKRSSATIKKRSDEGRVIKKPCRPSGDIWTSFLESGSNPPIESKN
eukprot:474716-Amorphochlora_amoeboformis.AAC.1